ncbi:hypothetical protein JG688_00008281 [Phytophthora aleatoria]|uniref:Uncharacterized protein n=1 Tax=Phytophthora aleatoria TaxID=2496075 RepID=A0A8J5M7H7_9STRA|nr:hypothetical protein JG688_00008281 [Phytophthora aleatoria]
MYSYNVVSDGSVAKFVVEYKLAETKLLLIIEVEGHEIRRRRRPPFPNSATSSFRPY